MSGAQEKYEKKFQKQVMDGWRPARITHLSQEVWDLIEACWHPDPNARPSMNENLRCLEDLESRIKDQDEPQCCVIC
jgi:hypothetical protein